jgi:hypothetical protein
MVRGVNKAGQSACQLSCRRAIRLAKWLETQSLLLLQLQTTAARPEQIGRRTAELQVWGRADLFSSSAGRVVGWAE